MEQMDGWYDGKLDTRVENQFRKKFLPKIT